MDIFDKVNKELDKDLKDNKVQTVKTKPKVVKPRPLNDVDENPSGVIED